MVTQGGVFKGPIRLWVQAAMGLLAKGGIDYRCWTQHWLDLEEKAKEEVGCDKSVNSYMFEKFWG